MCDNWEPKIGRTIRVRLPNDYVVSNGPPVKANRILKSPTFDDFAMLQEIRARFAAARAVENTLTENALYDLLFSGYVPPTPTPWQRRLAAIKRFPRRVRDAWRVLTGEASVYDDDY